MPGIDTAHLVDMSINDLIGKKVIDLADIKQYPLYRLGNGDYLFLDKSFFMKKVYIGPFFELFKRTGLQTHFDPDPKKNFNPYSSLISLEVLEKAFFQGIIGNLSRRKHDVLHFDDGSDSAPDGYFRNNKTIFLIEFKGYIFPSALAQNADFDAIKKYIDERFVKSDKGKKKGIGQLAEQISLLQSGKYGFDGQFNQKIQSGRYVIYPIICHTDYYFSLPGVNEYLSENFKQLAPATPNCLVKNLTVIDLTTLFHLAINPYGFDDLKDMIDRYHHILKARKEKSKKRPSSFDFLNNMASFDEVFRTILHTEKSMTERRKIKTIENLLNLNDDELKEPI